MPKWRDIYVSTNGESNTSNIKLQRWFITDIASFTIATSSVAPVSKKGARPRINIIHRVYVKFVSHTFASAILSPAIHAYISSPYVARTIHWQHRCIHRNSALCGLIIQASLRHTDWAFWYAVLRPWTHPSSFRRSIYLLDDDAWRPIESQA